MAYRIGPNTGFAARTTTAFWTVERVTSEPLTRRLEAAICWLHLLPMSKDMEPTCSERTKCRIQSLEKVQV